MNNRKKLVLCFSTESMKSEIWTNKHHLMSRLSKREDFDVVYVDQGMSTREIKNALKNRDWNYFLNPIWKFNDGFTCLSFYFLPLIKGGVFKRVAWWLVFLFLKRWIDETSYSEVIIWTYQPQSWYFIKNIDQSGENRFILYDCVDDFKTQPFYRDNDGRKKELLKIEEKLVKRADVVTTTSLKLYEDKKKQNQSTHYIHNVGDFEHFKHPGEKFPDDLEYLNSKNEKKVVYAGVIDDYKIDINLIDHASDDKDLFFLFLGPVRVKDQKKLLNKIKDKSNVHFYGYLDYDLLPSVLHACDVIWLPYQKNEHTQYVFPLKLFEAFATGKQVVAKNLDSYQKYHEYMQVFEEAEEAHQQLLQDPIQEEMELRKNVAKENSWESRLNKILELIKQEH